MDYEKQAIDFLQKTDTSVEIQFEKHGKHFDDDHEDRDIYRVTVTRGDRSFTVQFGQSVQHSRDKTIYGLENELRSILVDPRHKYSFSAKKRVEAIRKELEILTKYVEQPSAKDFCSDYGFNEDSRKGEKIYNAVIDEWKNVERIWTDKEIAELQDIQ